MKICWCLIIIVIFFSARVRAQEPPTYPEAPEVWSKPELVKYEYIYIAKAFIVLIVSLLIAFPLKAQDTTKPFYFPHKKGDMWEYYYYDGPMSVDTLQNFTICDSTESNGIIFMKQHARVINPIGPSYFFYPDTTKFWIDTLNNYVYNNSRGFDSTLVYKLDAKKGEQWLVNGWPPGETARVKDR